VDTQLYADSIVQTIREPLLVLDADLRIKTANAAFHRTFKIPPEQTTGRLIYELGGGEWNIAALRKMLERILPSDVDCEEFSIDQNFSLVGPKNLVLNARRLHDADKRAQLILLAIEDLTARRNAETDLAHHRTWLSVTLSSIGDAVIATDTNARISFMNPTAEKLTGWPQQQAVGQPLAEVFNIVNEETRQTVESPVNKAIRQGQIVGLANHTILITRDKSERYIDDSAAPIRDAHGSIVGVVLVFRDIGERRQTEKNLEVSEARYRRLFEAAYDGILILDAQSQQVIDVNRFLIELLRHPREYFIGKRLWELGMFEDVNASKTAMDELRAKGYVRYENLPLRDRDGRQIPVEFVSNIYHEGYNQVLQCNIRDIRHRMELEGQRVALLAQEHAARVEAQASERANRSKDMFLATLSHEMRTPLNAILGWATILGRDDVSDADLKEGVAVIGRNARAQAKLIEDVLDVSRIVSDKLRLDIRPCSLSDVINSAVDTVRQEANKKGVSLETEIDSIPLHVSCDTARMQQVVRNLLSNAIKFTPFGGKIRVSVTRERSSARIQVTDTGEGIETDFLPHVFDRFRQADAGSKRKSGGLGLGLSIVKHLIELHGGTVRAESEGAGHGAIFTVYLPIQALRVDESADKAEIESPWAPRVDSSSASIEGLRIMVVDDEADSRRLLVKILRESGAIVSSAGTAADAIAQMLKSQPDILISDLGMPEMDGFELIQQLRGAGYGPTDIPAVALSAFAHTDDQRKAILAGFQMHIAKPVDPHELIATLAHLAGRGGPNSKTP
jgi:PAS domain S-box-containing protein